MITGNGNTSETVYATCVPCEEKAPQQVHEADWMELEDMEAPKPVRGLNPEAAKRYGCKACGVSLGQAHLPDCSTGLGLGGSDAGESD